MTAAGWAQVPGETAAEWARRQLGHQPAQGMTNLQQLVATQAALDVRAVLDAARNSEPTDAAWIDLIDAMSDERIAAAFASLALLVVSVPSALTRYQRDGAL